MAKTWKQYYVIRTTPLIKISSTTLHCSCTHATFLYILQCFTLQLCHGSYELTEIWRVTANQYKVRYSRQNTLFPDDMRKLQSRLTKCSRPPVEPSRRTTATVRPNQTQVNGDPTYVKADYEYNCNCSTFLGNLMQMGARAFISRKLSQF